MPIWDSAHDTAKAPAPEAADTRAERAAGAADLGEAPKPQSSAAELSTDPPAPELPLADNGDVSASAPQGQVFTPAAPGKFLKPSGKGKLFAALPSVDFGGATMKAPVAAGEGPSGYLNIVVGMVRSHLHKPQDTRANEGLGYGVIVFTLDSQGHIIDSWFVQHSGSSALDSAEFDAVAAAERQFPAPADRH